jgi:hypothetical protein
MGMPSSSLKVNAVHDCLDNSRSAAILAACLQDAGGPISPSGATVFIIVHH